MVQGLRLLALAAALGLPATAQGDDVDALLKRLGSERQEERDAATRELIRRGRAVRPALERLGKDRDPEIAGRARAIVEAIDFNMDAALEVVGRLAEEEKGSHQRFLWRVDKWLQKAVAGGTWEGLLSSLERQKTSVTDVWERDWGIDHRILVRKDAIATPQGQTLDLFFEFRVKRITSPLEKTRRVLLGSKAGLLAAVRRPLLTMLATPLFPADSAIQKVLTTGNLDHKDALPIVEKIEMTYGPINDRWRETIPSGFHVEVTCASDLEARIYHFRSSSSVESELDPVMTRDGHEVNPGVHIPQDRVGAIRGWGGSGSIGGGRSSYHGLERLDRTTTRQAFFYMNYATELVPEAWSPPDLAALPQTIRSLRVRGTFVKDGDLTALTRFRALETLHLCENDFGDAALAPLAELPSLSSLCIRGPLITDRGVERFRTFPKLAQLELGQMALLTDEGLARIGERTSLTRLEIRGARKITDKGLRAIYGLSNLEELDFWLSDAISDDGLAALAKLPRLRFAELSDLKSITPAGWAALAKAPSLKELYFNYCSLDDAGLAELGRIKDLEFLAYYQMREDGKITDAGLLGLKDLTNLRRLRLYSKPLTEEGVKALQKQLPGRYVAY